MSNTTTPRKRAAKWKKVALARDLLCAFGFEIDGRA
jgi:hypothetical protein